MLTEEIRKKMIVTADDFGINHEVNTKIILLAETKKIDRVSVLINNQFSKNEISSLLGTDVAIDIHLDLPFSIKINKHSRGESAFKRSLIFLINYYSSKISANKMEREWGKQITRFEELFARKPDGINSHQHIHYFTPYFEIALRLATAYQIKYIRFGKAHLLQCHNNVQMIIYFFQKRNLRIFQSSNLYSSDYITSMDWISDLNEFLNNLPEGKTELVCHPEREDEFALIKSRF